MTISISTTPDISFVNDVSKMALEVATYDDGKSISIGKSSSDIAQALQTILKRVDKFKLKFSSPLVQLLENVALTFNKGGWQDIDGSLNTYLFSGDLPKMSIGNSLKNDVSRIFGDTINDKTTGVFPNKDLLISNSSSIKNNLVKALSGLSDVQATFVLDLSPNRNLGGTDESLTNISALWSTISSLYPVHVKDNAPTQGMLAYSDSSYLIGDTNGIQAFVRDEEQLIAHCRFDNASTRGLLGWSFKLNTSLKKAKYYAQVQIYLPTRVNIQNPSTSDNVSSDTNSDMPNVSNIRIYDLNADTYFAYYQSPGTVRNYIIDISTLSTIGNNFGFTVVSMHNRSAGARGTMVIKLGMIKSWSGAGLVIDSNRQLLQNVTVGDSIQSLTIESLSAVIKTDYASLFNLIRAYETYGFDGGSDAANSFHQYFTTELFYKTMGLRSTAFTNAQNSLSYMIYWDLQFWFIPTVLQVGDQTVDLSSGKYLSVMKKTYKKWFQTTLWKINTLPSDQGFLYQLMGDEYL